MRTIDAHRLAKAIRSAHWDDGPVDVEFMLDMITLIISEQPTANAVVLPCKIKTTVYHVYSPKHPADPEDVGKWFVAEGWVSRFLYGAKGLSAEIQWIGTLPTAEFGRTLFFTKEAAEAALAERRKRHETD